MKVTGDYMARGDYSSLDQQLDRAYRAYKSRFDHAPSRSEFRQFLSDHAKIYVGTPRITGSQLEYGVDYVVTHHRDEMEVPIHDQKQAERRLGNSIFRAEFFKGEAAYRVTHGIVGREWQLDLRETKRHELVPYIYKQGFKRWVSVEELRQRRDAAKFRWAKRKAV